MNMQNIKEESTEGMVYLEIVSRTEILRDGV
jgi:hypothetical protein